MVMWSCLDTDGFWLWPYCHLFIFAPSHMVSDYLAAYRMLNPRPLTSWPFYHETYTFSHNQQLPYSYIRSWTSQPIVLPADNYVSASKRLLPLQALPSLSILFNHTPSSQPIVIRSQCVLALTANYLIKTYPIHYLPLVWTQFASRPLASTQSFTAIRITSQTNTTIARQDYASIIFKFYTARDWIT